MSKLKLMKSDLGICPTILTLQGKPTSFSNVQDSRTKIDSPQKLKCGGVACRSLKAKKAKHQQGTTHQGMKKRIKQVWHVKAPQALGLGMMQMD